MRTSADSFDREMQRLQNEFPDALYTPQKAEMIFSVAKQYTQNSMYKVVSHFIATMRKAPLPNDFFEAFKTEERYRETKEEACDPILCKKCDDLGLVKATTWDFVTMWATCDCGRGTEHEGLPRLNHLRNATFEKIVIAVLPGETPFSPRILREWKDLGNLYRHVWSNYNNEN